MTPTRARGDRDSDDEQWQSDGGVDPIGDIPPLGDIARRLVECAGRGEFDPRRRQRGLLSRRGGGYERQYHEEPDPPSQRGRACTPEDSSTKTRVCRHLPVATHTPSYLLSRWIFLRLLGLTYLVAFASLGTQVVGLIGADGILPAADYFDRLFDTFGTDAYRTSPSLLWLSSSDLSLRVLCGAGVVLSGLLAAGVAPAVVLPLLWVSYLSLTIGGQTFLAFQWDTLLLETGLLACFYAPSGWRPTLATQTPPAPMARWLLWWLLFRLMFLSGITKLATGDPTWANLTALSYHYQTQPLPLWTGWYAHQLPVWAHQASAACMFVVELVLPWAIFAPPRYRRWRLGACVGFVLLQVGIGVTGNYGFFSLLSVLLCLTLVDDRGWRRTLPFLPAGYDGLEDRVREAVRGWRGALVTTGAVVLFGLGGG